MANPGVGNKFVSVNLNKSYGQPNHHGSSANHRRGMVVLSRPRSSHKAASKLSVPPPLNLPSLRREHEKFDSLGSSGGPAGAGGASGSGARPSSSGMGWTKPAPPPEEKEAPPPSVYLPPSARPASNLPAVSFPPLEKASVLRGEDFPSLRAALPSVAPTPPQRQKDGSQKQKQVVESQRNLDVTSYDDKKVRPVAGARVVRSQEEHFPIVWVGPRSDWADDERDTSFGVGDRGRDHGFAKSEAFWDRDFDMPRVSVLPHKPVQNSNSSERWGQQRDNEAGKGPSGQVLKREPHSREGNSWKSSPFPRDGPNAAELGPRPSSANRENKYNSSSLFRENGRGNEQNRYRDGTPLQKGSMFKPAYSSNTRAMPVNDPILNFVKDKRQFSKPYVEDDSFTKDYGATDPFTGGPLGVVKRKKDATKQTNFHDPVRESFEAELERVQSMQEQERRRAAEEQERALELVRREEEERVRLFREQEDRRRKSEEEAREAAWRAEQDQFEAARRAEELRIAREEEKRRIFLEEERRKEAAKQKFLELEQKIAKRQSEPRNAALAEDKDKEEVGDWEEGERMVERITTSASSDSSGLNRSQFSRDGAGFVDRGKPFSSWRRETYDNGNGSALQYQDPDIGGGGRIYPRKEFYGGPVPAMPPKIDDFAHSKGQRWNLSGDGDHYDRNQEIGPEINDQFGDVGWGQGRFRGSAYPQYPNPEADAPYSYGRSRYSVRQPRVLPPPSFASAQKSLYRNELERPGPSTSYVDRNESDPQMPYDSSHHGQPELINGQQDKNGKTTPRYDSQSSLSVLSSPPSSPTHLSHDDLDETGVSSGEGGSKDVSVSGQESEVVGLGSNADVEKMIADSAGEDDDEWTVENSEDVQEQEEYDDGYEEEDEVHEGDDELRRELDDMCLEEKESAEMMDNLVLGFDEGVEVGLPSDDKNASDLVDGDDSENVQPLDGSPKVVVSVGESENGNANLSGESKLMDFAEASQQQPVVSPLPLTQGEAPIKLQFGLFSGPSLIPSPVPAIQIGSIQMPLHLHPQISHMHNPPQPLFQFGQLRYSSPISQGMMPLPLPPQPMSYVQPNIPSSFPFNQAPVGPLYPQPNPDPPQTQPAAGSKVTIVPRQSKEDVAVERCQSETSYVSGDSMRPSNSRDQPRDKNLIGQRVQQQGSGGRGKRFVFAVKNSGPRPFPAPESNRPDSIGYQRRPRRNVPRTEFQVRESADKRQFSGSISSGDIGFDEKPNSSGKGTGFSSRPGPRRIIPSHRAPRQSLQPEIPVSSREMDSGSKAGKGPGKDSSAKGHNNVPQSGEGRHKRNMCEEDVDAPLQSGVVRVFEQPGIEAPSDEDDFIKVRSKRQMLNDRREQREKEFKAKSRVAKVPRKTRSTMKITSSTNSGKVSAAAVGANARLDYVATEGRELLSGFTTATSTSQPLAPIGTPAVKSETQPIRPVQINSNTAVSAGNPVSFDNKIKVLDGVQPSLNTWGNSRINQQVMALTQAQLEEAMTPRQLNSRDDSNVASSSILTKDKPFSSTASPVNSLLAGEKIQFGAVTSPTLLPPSSRVVSHGIGPPGPSRPDAQLSHNLSAPENDCKLVFDKEKHVAKSCVPLEDCEAEAEAAASAVAVAAISNDEIVGICSVSVSETKSFGGTDDGKNQQFGCRSRADESLAVSLPADLSVENPPISMWPPLPSPPNSSSQMLSHFPGGPHPHYPPFFEMNPMLGSPVFAFGPHDESAPSNTQSLPQKGTPAWPPQCHSGVDSFYGPPAGFSGPFIGPPGVQGPPHMVVYNHFAPFGQVGLSFMGTYIPSGKQPGEGDSLRNPSAMPPPIQHLAPGAPLLPMPPVPMFDVSPFQSPGDMSVQARWPHVASKQSSVQMSMPMQQQEPEVAAVPVADQSSRPEEQQESLGKPAGHVKATTAAKHNIGYGYRGGASSSHRNNSGEWNRRMGFQGRNHSLGGIHSSKPKQIYVPKQTSSSAAGPT